jgi:hypothetical protein
VEENQDLKVCQDMHILPFEKNYGNVRHQLQDSSGGGKRFSIGTLAVSE